MLNINLPDAAVGHAILETQGSRFHISPSSGHDNPPAKCGDCQRG